MVDRGLPEPFKRCPSCGFEWQSREDFLEDPEIGIVGYQVNFTNLEAGFFLFNHPCGTTLGLATGAFKSLYDGPIIERRATGSDECPEYCVHTDELGPCPAECECAYVRSIIQLIRNWPKRDRVADLSGVEE